MAKAACFAYLPDGGSWEQLSIFANTTLPEPMLRSPHDFSLQNTKKSWIENLSIREKQPMDIIIECIVRIWPRSTREGSTCRRRLRLLLPLDTYPKFCIPNEFKKNEYT
jgi:hypothetical protein